MPTTLFTWGYYGWGNATSQLVEMVDAVERARGFAPPMFVDIRIRRAVRAKGFQGDAFYAADNPPYGAVFTAFLKEKLKTKKEKRQEAEKEAAKKDQTSPYPTNDELRAEAEESKPELYFLVYDESGRAIRRVNGGTDSGFQRAAWDLRYAAPSVKKRKIESCSLRR